MKFNPTGSGRGLISAGGGYAGNGRGVGEGTPVLIIGDAGKVGFELSGGNGFATGDNLTLLLTEAQGDGIGSGESCSIFDLDTEDDEEDGAVVVIGDGTTPLLRRIV
jgi:hypothetical protein